MTVTSNIHVGLSAWSNHTFVTGERCSNSSNAYECTTPGTSTSAPTGTATDVDNGGAAHFKWLSAIDYTTIALWEAGIPATLTEPIVGQLWNNGVIQCALGTILFQIDGHVTTASFTITLKCAPGESIRDRMGTLTPLTADSTKGVTIRGIGSGGPTSVSYCWVSDDNVIFEGIQFVDPYAASASQMVICFNNNFRMDGCIIEGYSNSTAGANLLDLPTGCTTATIVNTLFHDLATSGPRRCISSADAGATGIKVSNCTFISASTSCVAINNVSATTNACVVKNCAAFGQTNAFTGSTALAMGVSNTVMGAASLPNATNVTGNSFSKTAANQFISATVDFRLKIGADAINLGVADLTNIPTGEGFFREIRPSSWDAGCHEYGIPDVPTINHPPVYQPLLVR